jgi:hypothetical protein
MYYIVCPWTSESTEVYGLSLFLSLLSEKTSNTSFVVLRSEHVPIWPYGRVGLSQTQIEDDFVRDIDKLAYQNWTVL